MQPKYGSHKRFFRKGGVWRSMGGPMQGIRAVNIMKNLGYDCFRIYELYLCHDTLYMCNLYDYK